LSFISGLLINAQIILYQLLTALKFTLCARRNIGFIDINEFYPCWTNEFFANSAAHHLLRQSLNGCTIVLSASLFLKSGAHLSLTASPISIG
jgi:hypothetical protein